MPNTIPQLSGFLQQQLPAIANAAACITGFYQRPPKVFTGAVFVYTLVFTFLQAPHASLAQLATTAARLVKHQVSDMAVHQRFTEAGAALLRQVLEQAISFIVIAPTVELELFRRFNGIYLVDATTIVLPPALAALWPGCGGTGPQGERGAIKIQVLLNLSNGQLNAGLQRGRSPDVANHIAYADLPTGCLRVADLGYFSIVIFQTIAAQGSYFLSRLRFGSAIYALNGQQLDLLTWLPQQGGQVVDVDIYLGQAQLRCRLVAMPVPQAVAAERRRKLYLREQKHHRQPKAAMLAWQDWSIYVTNASAAQLSVAEISTLPRSPLPKLYSRLEYCPLAACIVAIASSLRGARPRLVWMITPVALIREVSGVALISPSRASTELASCFTSGAG
jgi:Transposase DDE domain